MRADTRLAAASTAEAEPLAAPSSSSQEIVDLVQMFGSIADPQHRSALMAVARMMSSPYQEA